MKRQWGLIFSLIFALIIAVFSVVNVNDVKVNYVFGTAQWPLILVILGSVLMGALLLGSFGIVRMFRLQRTISRLKKELNKSQTEIERREPEKAISTESKESVQDVTENEAHQKNVAVTENHDDTQSK